MRSSPAASMAFDGNTIADAGAVREDALARLAVVGRAAAQVSADRDPHDHRARPRVGRPVAQHRHLVAKLHHGRPDVVEELDFDDRLQSARGHADRAADDVGFGERRVEHAVGAVDALQPVRDLEHAALAGHVRQRAFAAAVGDVLAEDDDARVDRHFVLQRAIDGRHHRVGLAIDIRVAVEPIRGRIDVRREHVQRGGVGRRLLRRQRPLGGLRDFAVHVGGQRLQTVGGDESLRPDEIRHPDQRIAPRFGFAFSRRLVEPLVIGERV